MIKVTLGAEAPQTEKPFPKLMKEKFTGNLFFFYKERVGLPLEQPDRFDDYGIVISDWATSWNMDGFTDYNEPITLQNA